MLSNKNLVMIATSMLLADFAFLSFVSWTVEFIQNKFVLTQEAAIALALYFGIAAGIGGIGVIVGGMIYDKFGGKRTSLLCGTAMAALSFSLFVSDSYLFTIAAMFATGFFSNWFWGILTAMAQDNVSAGLRPTAVSFVQSVAFAGALLGPAVAGFLIETSAPSSAFPLIATVSLPFAIFTFIILFVYRDRSVPVFS
ncbi:MAG: MFS transporter, partial [Nitrososphaerales archaeon]